MKLSEAMRLGSMQVPPTRPGENVLVAVGDDWEPCAACALGAVAIAAGVDPLSVLTPCAEAVARFPLLGQDVTSPVDYNPVVPMPTAINYLFEHERWSRERIADWIEQIEQSIESQVSRVLSPGEEELDSRMDEHATAIVGNTRGSDR